MDRFWLTEPALGFFEPLARSSRLSLPSRRVSLMPHLKTAKPAGPRSTVPYFTCFEGCFNYLTYFYLFLLKGPSLGHLVYPALNLPHSVLFPPKINQHNEPRSRLSESHWHDLYVPFNGKIQPVCCPCVTYATVPCCTSRWSAMDLLRWAHLFPHEDDVAVWLCWESERDLPRQHSNQQLAQWNTNILLRI